jgi:ABC-2 type transport system permease protein
LLSWREALTYRVDLIADLLSSAILLGIYYFLWQAVFEARPTIEGLDFTFMTSYIALARIVQGFVQTEPLEYEIAHRVEEGSISLDLLRPYNLQICYYLKAYSQSLISALLISVPILAFSLFALRLAAPEPLRCGIFLLSLHLGFAVNAGLSFLVGLAAFPLRNNEGIAQLKKFITTLLSGNLFPIVLLPSLIKDFNGLLPFRAIIDVPIGIYLGHLPPTLLVFQALWAVALGLLGYLLFLRARRRLVVLGG